MLFRECNLTFTLALPPCTKYIGSMVILCDSLPVTTHNTTPHHPILRFVRRVFVAQVVPICPIQAAWKLREYRGRLGYAAAALCPLCFINEVGRWGPWLSGPTVARLCPAVNPCLWLACQSASFPFPATRSELCPSLRLSL